MTFAYSKALALESLAGARLSEKFDEERQTYHNVTAADLESYARTVAYKVAWNLKNGLPMDEGGDPLRYVDCENV